MHVDSMRAQPFVFFDLGGTLVDLRGIVASMAAQLHTLGVRGPVPLALRWATMTAEFLPSARGKRFRPEREITADILHALLEKRGRQETREDSMRLVREAWSGFVSTCALHGDVSVTWVRNLRSRVAGIGLVTDGDTEAVAGVLAHLDLAGLFDSVTTSEAIQSYKPNPEIYRAALKSIGAKPSQSLFVSDATLDLHGAAELGMSCAWIPRGLLPNLADAPPKTVVLSSLGDIERMIKGYSKVGRFRLR